MDILNWGSMNIDHVYKVKHFIQPGETVAADDYSIFPGGKGLNQSIAIARAGERVFHAGATGAGGELLMDCLAADGIDARYVRKTTVGQGHAIIQVNPEGENCILIYAGSNRRVEREQVDRTLADFGEDTLVVLQNEISNVDYIVERARAKGMKIVLNPSPMDEAMERLDFGKVEWLLVNEVEGRSISGFENPDRMLDEIHGRFPGTGIVLTLGDKGCYCLRGERRTHQDIFPIVAKDTTAAGDTFTGYFVAGLARGDETETVLRDAAAAAAISVSREGASVSIPRRDEVTAFLRNRH